ncbi:MAG: sugar transferase, partial [Nitrososphaeria archaeon]
MAVAAVYKLYDSPATPNPAGGRIRKSLVAYLSFVFLYFGFIVLSQGFTYSREFHLFFLLCVLIAIGINSILYSSTLSFFAIRGRLSRNVLLVGAGTDGRKFMKATEAPVSGYKVIGVFDDDERKARQLNGLYLGKVSELGEWLKKKDKFLKVDEIVVALPPVKMDVIQEVIGAAERNFLNVKLIPPLRNLYPGLSFRLEHLDGIPLMVRREDKMSYLHNRIVKRIMDIVISLLALVIVFPFLYIISLILIKFSSPGPVFFKQKRKGYRGDVFTCYKFRTMKVVPQEVADELQATPDDPRKTKVGDFYRRKNLDEFPQFINVLKG